ncbi:hypothetical protein DERP_005427 [Dermatophagoides pteronyssinus]|uniref:Uncharacterized protein n=1 Tax=Dermatophagoides pteronyssinus TaxID=6956 RepID=A0ABQ8JMJ8_DERPT|nr:hypothetical protein DERP_005427 [Dermatophagoides pteronyssinus]
MATIFHYCFISFNIIDPLSLIVTIFSFKIEHFNHDESDSLLDGSSKDLLPVASRNSPIRCFNAATKSIGDVGRLNFGDNGCSGGGGLVGCINVPIFPQGGSGGGGGGGGGIVPLPEGGGGGVVGKYHFTIKIL